MRTSPGILFLTVWLVSACLVTGGVAAVTGMPSLWGSGVWFLEYALPVPWGWGLVHWPGLIVFGGLVKAASANPAKWRPALRDCALGTLGGLLFVCLLMPEAGGFPLLMYLAVDAVLGLAGSTILVMPADALLPSYRTRIMMLLGPAVLVLAVFLLWPLVGERYRVSMTDTVI